MHLTHGLRVLGVVLLALLFSGAHTAAQGAGGQMLALQDEEFCEVADTAGTPDADAPGGTPAALAVENGATPASAGGDIATPGVDDILGDDGVVDEDDEGALCEDIDGDGTFEIGFDNDKDGSLDEDEVLGVDVNNDEALALDELDPEVAVPENAPEGPVDESTEGYLREDVDADGTFEIGIDEDASGTLDESEVLGSDVNNDEVLTEDEFVPGFGETEEGDD